MFCELKIGICPIWYRAINFDCFFFCSFFLQIQWLLENYETAEGVSLPRCTLYNHYLRHCAANKIDAVNAASFGKLIRSVFIGLKTRRLGTRCVLLHVCVCVSVESNECSSLLSNDCAQILKSVI